MRTSNKMEEAEQITTPVEATPAPIKKDPKKVAAGKALARKNKETKLKLVEKQQGGSSMFQNASIMVGSALVLYHGYQAVKELLPKPAPPPPPIQKVENSRKEENRIQME